jgi:hypothetical protein
MKTLKATVSRLLSVHWREPPFTLIGAGSAGAQVLKVPEDVPGVPAYARVERPFVYHTDQWPHRVLPHARLRSGRLQPPRSV